MNKICTTVLEDILLGDPISQKGKDAMKRAKVNISFNEFYRNVYVEPFFVNASKPKDTAQPEENGTETYTYDEYVISKDFAFSDYGSWVRHLSSKKQQYESLFFSKQTDQLLLIRASSGAGKSIYLNNLKWLRRKENYPNALHVELEDAKINKAYELNFDLEQSAGKIQCGKTSFPSPKYRIDDDLYEVNTAPWRFFIMIIEAIFNFTYSIANENDYNTCKKIEKNFRKVYGVDCDDEIENLYKLLKYRFIKINSLKSEQILRTTLLDTILKICVHDAKNVNCCIKVALTTLTRLIICKTNIDYPEQLLISFDNIEHYIKSSNRIYDKDIKTITDSVLDFAKEEDKYYIKKGLCSFASYFKIIMVVRDTTDKMFSQDVHSYFTEKDRSIDITDWYPIEQIYNSKIQHFIPEANTITGSLKNDSPLPSTQFIDLMITDCEQSIGNNILNVISFMYNHNYRRSTRILTRISGILDQKDEDQSRNTISLNYNQYHELWNWQPKSTAKNLCRQAVIRLIYNEIEQKSFFNRIHDDLATQKDIQNTYAAHILIWLSNIQSLHNEDYISFYELAKVFLCPVGVTDEPFASNENGKTLNKPDVDKLSEVLIALDEHRFSNTDNIKNNELDYSGNCWCQLIVIKFNETTSSGTMTVDALSQKICEAYKNKDKNSKDYGIKITEAGRFFAKSLQDFEYFACRYASSNSPLIFMLDAEQIKSTIKTVFYKAKDYIDNTILLERALFHKQYEVAYDIMYHLKFYSKSNNLEFRSLPYRIIQQHTYYLNMYKKYIEDDDLHNKINLFTDNDRTEISEYIDKYLNKYKAIVGKLKKDNYKINGEQISGYILYKNK